MREKAIKRSIKTELSDLKVHPMELTNKFMSYDTRNGHLLL